MTPQVVADLLAWFYQNQRDLPWRKTQDPYAIWLSEVMLQQTQVDTVIPYYYKFLEAYPTVEALANADTETVLKLWEGLGYYSRAKRLIACAQMVVDQFDGVFPRTKAEMLKLPGVGSYTAGAVLGIAYNVKEPAVDGNVLRVIARFLAWDLDIGDPKNRLSFENYLSEYLPEDMRAFNQALMELGATVCTPKAPKCGQCPIRSDCQALSKELVDQLPVKSKKKPAPAFDVAVALIADPQGRLLMFQKDEAGLLGGFWAFPYGLGETPADALSNLHQWLQENLGLWWLKAGDLRPLHMPKTSVIKHVFTHQVWKMVPYCATIEANMQAKLTIDYPPIQWVDQETAQALPITTAMRKIEGTRRFL